MRLRTVILTIFLLPIVSWSQIKTAPEFFIISKKMREELRTEKTKEKKILKLKDLEKQLLATQKQFEIKNPIKGDEIEKKVNFFYFTFEPLFEAKNFDSLGCKKTEHQLILEDKMGKEETEALTPDAKEAIEWLHLICK
ncbi:MAG: hypothetical protein IPM97_06690 [Bdellovibrionaceae bacterium]|nr:hypothetical protein [Pseudobdellovibrionaceae bacterium]